MGMQGVDNNFMNTLTSQMAIKQRVEQNEFEALLKKATDRFGDDDQALKEACGEFEAYFVNTIFSKMRQSIPKSNLYEEAQGHSIYEDMLYEAYSKEISKGQGIGIKNMLYQQLKKSGTIG